MVGTRTNTCCKRFAFIFIGALFTSVQLLYFFSGVVRENCSAPTFTLRSLKVDSLCSSYNSYQSTLEVNSKCPFTISLVDFDLWFTAGDQRVAATHVRGFDVHSGRNIIQIDSTLNIFDDANFTNLHNIVKSASYGYSTELVASASVSGSVVGYSFSGINFRQELACVNCDSSGSTGTDPADPTGSTGAGGSGGGSGGKGKYTAPSIRLKSIESGGPKDEHSFESSFTLQVESLPMDNVVISVPTIDFDIYEDESFLGTVTIHEVQFGSVSNLIPLSTLLHQSAVAKVVIKALKEHHTPPTLTVYGSTRAGQTCAVQKAIAGVKLGSVPLPKYEIQDLLPYVDLPSVSFKDIVTSATLHVNVPLYLNVDFTLFSLPSMVFEVDSAPSKSPIVTITVPQFTLTPSQLSITIAMKTVNAHLLQGFVNALVLHDAFPVDVTWTVGNTHIFEIISYNTYVDYASIYYIATDWARQSALVLYTATSHNDTGAFQAYSASLSVFFMNWYYSGTIFDTGRIPLFYKDQYFGDGELSATVSNYQITFTAAAYLTNNDHGSVVSDIWYDLKHNRLPPGIRLIAAGNPNYQIGNVIDAIVNYLGNEIQIPTGEVVDLSEIGDVEAFNYGNNNGVYWMSTTLIAGSGLQNVFKLDHLTIYPSTNSLNATQESGNHLKATMYTSFFNPVFNFAFYISGNATADFDSVMHLHNNIDERQTNKVIIS